MRATCAQSMKTAVLTHRPFLSLLGAVVRGSNLPPMDFSTSKCRTSSGGGATHPVGEGLHATWGRDCTTGGGGIELINWV